jgi:magnesium chelatase subunit I
MAVAAMEVQDAFDLLPEVKFAPGVERTALGWVKALQIESHRAEITLLEAGRAHAAIDGRTETTLDDLKVIAPMALRQRQSNFMRQYIESQTAEDEKIRAYVNES